MVNISNNISCNDRLPDFNLQNINDIDITSKVGVTKGKWHTLIFITNGNGVLQIDFDEHLAIKNKVFFIEKYKIWDWIKTDNIEGVMVQFTDSFYNHIYTGNPKIKSDQSLIGEMMPFLKFEESEEADWKNIFNLILKEYIANKENSKEIICLTLKILILKYRRNFQSADRSIIADRKKQLLIEFRKLVNSKFFILKNPKDYAEKLNISPNYLNTICKENYNKTLSEIIQDRVILEAKRLLAHTDLSVSEVSFKLGFKDNSYFGRYFKKVVGKPPEKYRKVNYINH